MLEKNNSVYSLTLNQKSSLDRGIGVAADNLLSIDDEFCRRNSEDPTKQQETGQTSVLEPQLIKIQNEDALYLVSVLGLDQVRTRDNVISLSETDPKPKQQEDTKNVLRNFGNAQNQYILYNSRAQRRIRKTLNDIGRFHKWVRQLKLENFQQFKAVWSGDNGGNRVYTHLYRELCWMFYTEEASCYVLSSRMKSEVTKNTHLKYIYRFLQGIINPSSFSYFKKQ